MSRNSNGTDASTAPPRGGGRSATARRRSNKKAANAASSANGNDQPPKLKGTKYEFIKPAVETQRARLQHAILQHTRSMLDTHDEIRRRAVTSSSFTTPGKTYSDKYNPDKDGNAPIKRWIPGSLRKKMPLNISKTARRDSRCASEFSAMNAQLDMAHRRFQAFQDEMAVIAGRIAEQEKEARITILRHQYGDALLSIAEGLAVVGREKFGIKTNVSARIMALTALNDCLKDLPDPRLRITW